MARKPAAPPPPTLASVTKLKPPARRGGTLTSAIGRGASEREVLELLRRRLAAALDRRDGSSNLAALIATVGQFRSVDAEIRALDAAEAEAAREATEEAAGRDTDATFRREDL